MIYSWTPPDLPLPLSLLLPASDTAISFMVLEHAHFQVVYWTTHPLALKFPASKSLHSSLNPTNFSEGFYEAGCQSRCRGHGLPHDSFSVPKTLITFLWKYGYEINVFYYDHSIKLRTSFTLFPTAPLTPKTVPGMCSALNTWLLNKWR